jgi:hypothetical protein
MWHPQACRGLETDIVDGVKISLDLSDAAGRAQALHSVLAGEHDGFTQPARSADKPTLRAHPATRRGNGRGQNGGFARACPLADSHGPLTVSPSDTAADRPVRIGQDGGAVSAVVIDRSRTVLMERCRVIVR